MADRWLYIHAGAAHGPVDLAKLAKLAAQGKLLPTDQVWPAGEDRRRAVEAHTLLNAELFRTVQGKVEETLASPPLPASATPDWLTDVAALSAPASPSSSDAELVIVDETPDVEVVEEPVPLAAPIEPPAKPGKVSKPPAPPKRSAAANRKASSPSKPRPASKDADEPEEEEEGDAEDNGLGFRRRDLVAFGLGVVGVCLAVAAGLFFAKPWRQRSDDVPPNDDRGEKNP